jgi:ADP-ribosylglycohydrolase
MSDKFNKYFASIYLAMIGDKIGFGNGDRERNYLNTKIVTENNPNYVALAEGISTLLIFKFIAEGGVSGLDLDKLMYSDDTVMHMGTMYGLIEDYKSRSELYDNVTKYYLEDFKDTNISKMRDVLLAGRQTLEAIKNIKAGGVWRTFPYNKSAGGSGAPMRTMCIGLAFYTSNSLLKLVESSIMIASITHPNCTAFLGSIASALFTSYALRDLNPESWIFELIRVLEGTTIDDIIEKVKPSYVEHFKEDKKLFLHIFTANQSFFNNDYN